MKTIAAFLLIFSFSLTSYAQDFSGQWNGALKIQGTQLRLVFNISKSGATYSTTMDSPDQGAKGIPVPTTIVEGNKLTIEMPSIKLAYSGELKNNIIEGTFKQGGMEFPMNLSKDPISKQTFNRPQDPSKPYPYYSEDITFSNPKANITLAGTLTLPKQEGVFPVVVLITGSGPQNRNEELLGHKPFLVISDYLTKKGIAVLRFDDRGVAQSKGSFKTATTADFATDVESAIAYLKTRKEINPKKIGLMGHSEGGVVAPIVASGSKDISFIVLLAGTGLRGDNLLLLQQELIARVSGATESEIEVSKALNRKTFDMVLHAKNDQTLKNDITNFITATLKSAPQNQKPEGLTDAENVTQQVDQIMNPWMLYFIRFDPATALEKVKCPVLAVNGEKDLQVPPKENIAAIEKALQKAGNKKVTTKIFPNLNHLFQECKTGSPEEYAEIEQTFSPAALEFVAQWIFNQTK